MLSEEASSPEWDPSWPGTGAQRCTAITQLYFRLANYPSLTVLVVDALCLVFSDGGATQSELEAYLGLSDDRIRYALACIPEGMHCTSRDLLTAENAAAASSGRRAEEDVEVAHFLNFRRLLPIAYAHVTRMLLSLCRTPLPTAVAPVISAASPPLNLSRTLLLDKATDGILCRSCRFYHAVPDFLGGLAVCPTCGDDVLATTLKVVREKMDATCAQGKSLVSLPPGSAASVAARAHAASGTVASPTVASPVQHDVGAGFSTKDARAEFGIDCPLARDPFLVQQALAFFHLYTTRFAFVTGEGPLVCPDDILTEAEYHRRLQGRASVADLFRAAHRNPASIRVKLVSQKEVDDARTAENERKLAKRANLPPWLRPRSAASLLGPNMLDNKVDKADEYNGAEDNGDDGLAGERSSEVTARAKSGPDNREKRARASHATPTTTAGDAHRVTDVAAFVAKQFFYDDFDPVPLPHRRRE